MKKNLIGFLTITLPIFIVFFIIAEIVVRNKWVYQEIKGDTLIKHHEKNPMSTWAENDPFAVYTGKPGKYEPLDITINSDGFFATPEINKKEDDVTRIVFLGGSSTAGSVGLKSNNDTWPWKTIEVLKNKYNLKVDFINAAQGGYSTFESYGKLWSRLRFLDPDIIVMYHGWNDMYYFNDTYADNPLEWRKGFDLSGENIVEETIKPLGIDKYIGWSQFLIKFRLAITRRANKGNGEVGVNLNLKDTYNKKGLTIFNENLNLIKRFAEDKGIEFFVCKQATLITPTTSEEDKERCRYYYHGFDHDAHVNAFDEIYKIVEKEVSNNKVIDLTSLSGVSENFKDHIHQTVLGNNKISNIVADSLYNNYFKK